MAVIINQNCIYIYCIDMILPVAKMHATSAKRRDEK